MPSVNRAARQARSQLATGLALSPLKLGTASMASHQACQSLLIELSHLSRHYRRDPGRPGLSAAATCVIVVVRAHATGLVVDEGLVASGTTFESWRRGRRRAAVGGRGGAGNAARLAHARAA